MLWPIQFGPCILLLFLYIHLDYVSSSHFMSPSHFFVHAILSLIGIHFICALKTLYYEKKKLVPLEIVSHPEFLRFVSQEILPIGSIRLIKSTFLHTIVCILKFSFFLF